MTPEKVHGLSRLTQTSIGTSRQRRQVHDASALAYAQTASSRVARRVAGKSIITLEDV